MASEALVEEEEESSDDEDEEDEDEYEDDDEAGDGEVSSTAAKLDALDAGRPAWLPATAPSWVGDTIMYIRARPWLQLLIAFPLYALHVLYFSTGGWKLPQSAIPNAKGLFSNVGFDTAAGAVVALGTLLIRKVLLRLPRALPPLLSSEHPPWSVSRADKRKIANTTVLLVVAYLASGYGAVLIEQVLFLLVGLGVPLTIATTRAWKVLLGHLIWVFAGVKILRSKLNPFFPRRGSWLSWKWRTNWLAWAVGGYYVSAMFFNGADVLNHWLLPSSLFNEDTVVSKLINPENRDVMAMAVGCVGPCITAPVFEEVLYRGFLLPALACYLPMWAAIPVSSVLFAVHHLNIQGVLPLTVLGFIWAILYTKSNNLAVTIIIHAMCVGGSWHLALFTIGLACGSGRVVGVVLSLASSSFLSHWSAILTSLFTLPVSPLLVLRCSLFIVPLVSPSAGGTAECSCRASSASATLPTLSEVGLRSWPAPTAAWASAVLVTGCVSTLYHGGRRAACEWQPGLDCPCCPRLLFRSPFPGLVVLSTQDPPPLASKSTRSACLHVAFFFLATCFLADGQSCPPRMRACIVARARTWWPASRGGRRLALLSAGA